VEWVRIDEPNPKLHARGLSAQHVQPRLGEGRGEAQPPRGLLGDDDTIFFVSTSGGDVNNGDVNSDGYVESFG
jgi:uncharacterized protein